MRTVKSREFSEDMFVLHECHTKDELREADDKPPWYEPADETAHGNTNAFLITEERTLMFDTLTPAMTEEMFAEIETLLDGESLDYLVVSHPDNPHAGNTFPILKQYPEATLIAPKYGSPHEAYYLDRAAKVGEGDSLSLGDRRVTFHYAPFMDSGVSLWMKDERTGTLFTVDWIGFPHMERDCCNFVEELSQELTVDHLLAHSGDVFFWLEYVDTTVVDRTLDEIKRRYEPEIIAPSHGLVFREDTHEYLDLMKRMAKHMNERGRPRHTVLGE